MLDTVFAALRSQGQAWREEVARRRVISSADAVADTLVFCADELDSCIRQLASDSEWLTPEEFGAKQIPAVSGQTVRNWIRRGELKAEETPKGYRIARSSRRERKRKGAI